MRRTLVPVEQTLLFSPSNIYLVLITGSQWTGCHWFCTCCTSWLWSNNGTGGSTTTTTIWVPISSWNRVPTSESTTSHIHWRIPTNQSTISSRKWWVPTSESTTSNRKWVPTRISTRKHIDCTSGNHNALNKNKYLTDFYFWTCLCYPWFLRFMIH